MPDPVEQGPLDPDFAKFREKKIVEKLSEKLNAPSPSAPLPGPPPASREEGGSAAPFFGTGVPRRAEEEHDEKGRDEAPRPAGAPPLVGEPMRLIDIATDKAPELARAARPAAPSPKPAASAPGPAAQAKKPAASSASDRDDAVEAAPRIRDLTARPEARSDDGDLVERIVALRQSLSSTLGDLSHQLLELKVRSSEGIERAIASFEAEANHVHASLQHGEALSDEALTSASAASDQAAAQDALEERLGEVSSFSRKLRDRSDELRSALSELETSRAELEIQVAERSETVERTRSQVDILTERLADLEREEASISSVHSRLTENVARLERLKDESQRAIARLQESKEAFTAHV